MRGAGALINRFARAVTTYEQQATVQREAAEHLAHLLGQHFHTLAPRILEIGCGTGFLTRLILSRFAPSEMVVNDLCPEMGVCFTNVPRTTFLPGDAQTLEWPGQFDAVVSSSAIQWFHDLGAFTQRCAAILPKGGLLAVSGFGPATLKEVLHLSGRGLDYLDYEAFQAVFSDAFIPLACDRKCCTLHFKDGWDVLRHLKETGVTATGSAEKALWTRHRLAAFVADYQKHYADEAGGVRLTYEPFWFVGARK